MDPRPSPEAALQGGLTTAYRARFGRPPSYWLRAPGRVNLIGEHTDYNDGFVLPMAIDRAIWIALEPRTDSRLVLRSLDFDEEIDLALETLEHGSPAWSEYARGVAWALQGAGFPVKGWQGVAAGDVPIGAGLSSSAAFELALARAFAVAGGFAWDPVAMARLGQSAENNWVGVHCGIMDQLISACARADHALLIDCRSLQLRQVQLPPGTAVAVLDTGTRRGLAGSAYNERRAQCEAAAGFFQRPALRDVSLAELEASQAALDPLIFRRARHVVSENERTVRAAEALEHGQAAEFGLLMGASHRSLADDYEVSSPALDQMVAAARRHPGCFGARMTGAGFGGCAVALVDAAADDFAHRVARDYRQASGLNPSIFVSRATDGVSLTDSEPQPRG